ncbi:MAG: DUF5056 domain-containing protein [Phocaeicola sp.]
MKDRDELLISQFMQSNKHEIEDRGFSKKVMNRLPKPFLRTSEIMYGVCWIVAFYLFTLLDGWNLLLHSIDHLIATASYELLSNGNYWTVLLGVGVVTILGVQKACTTK